MFICAEKTLQQALQAYFQVRAAFTCLEELDVFLQRQQRQGIQAQPLFLSLSRLPVNAWQTGLARLHSLSGHPLTVIGQSQDLIQLPAAAAPHIFSKLPLPLESLHLDMLQQRLTDYQATESRLAEQNKRISQLMLENRHLRQRLAEESHYDPETGLLHRRALKERLAQEWRRAHRYQQPLSAIMLRFEGPETELPQFQHFRSEFVRRLKAIRSCDMAAHYEPNCFILLLPMTFKEGSLALSAHFRTQVHRLLRDHDLHQTQVLIYSQSEIPLSHVEHSRFLCALLEGRSQGARPDLILV